MAVLGILSSAVGAAAAVVGVAQSAKAASAAREQRRISGATEELRNRLARRSTAKRARINRARIANSAATDNVSGSSGELGGISALTSSASASIGQQSMEALSARGLSAASQREASAVSKIKSANAWAGLFNEVSTFAAEENIFGD